MPSDHQFPVEVFPDHTDCFGIVYHANFLRFMAHARVSWFHALGFNLPKLQSDGFIFPVAKATLEFTAPAFFGDQLAVMTRLVKLGRVSFVCEQKITRLNDPQALVCSGEIKLACVSPDLQPCPLPEAIIKELKSW